jgi:hypothetical protein
MLHQDFAQFMLSLKESFSMFVNPIWTPKRALQTIEAKAGSLQIAIQVKTYSAVHKVKPVPPV